MAKHDRSLPKHFSTVYGINRSNAANRGYAFELSKQEALDIMVQACFYCKYPPSNNYKTFFYSGIDRVDNNLGYIAGNCVPCCKVCNRSKNNLSGEEWLGWIRRLVSCVYLEP